MKRPRLRPKSSLCSFYERFPLGFCILVARPMHSPSFLSIRHARSPPWYPSLRRYPSHRTHFILYFPSVMLGSRCPNAHEDCGCRTIRTSISLYYTIIYHLIPSSTLPRSSADRATADVATQCIGSLAATDVNIDMAMGTCILPSCSVTTENNIPQFSTSKCIGKAVLFWVLR